MLSSATSTAPSSLLLHPISAPSRLLSSAAVVLWPARSPFSAGRLLITFFIVMHAAAAPIITGKGIWLSRRRFTKACPLGYHSSLAVQKQLRSRNLFDAPCRSLYSRRGRGGESEREIGCSVVPHSPLVKVLSRGGHMRRLAVRADDGRASFKLY